MKTLPKYFPIFIFCTILLVNSNQMQAGFRDIISQNTDFQIEISSVKVLEDSIFEYEVSGTFYNSLTERPVEGVEVSLFDVLKNSAMIQTIFTDESGKFIFRLKESSEYVIVGKKAGFFDTYQKRISTIGKNKFSKLEIKMPIQEIQFNANYKLENLEFEINNVNITSNSFAILDNFVNLLSENPNLVLEIACHTDSRGNDEYNWELSQKRAEEVASYLVKKGIDANRVFAKGYGESQLVNECGNGIKCNNDLHLQNRRVEFRILNK